MKRPAFKATVLALVASVAGAGWLAARETGQDPNQALAAPASAVAQTGLLPVFGVAVDIDTTQVDGSAFPSTLPNFGVGDGLQSLWDTYLHACGFNTLRFKLDVRDPDGSESVRLANLCLWAKQTGVRLVPVLIGSNQGEPLLIDFAAQSAKFVGAVAARFKGGDEAQLDAYGQILAYQLEVPLNHPANHGVPDEITIGEIKTAARSIREAETAAFEGLQIASTPMIVPASFDAELVKVGAIVGAQLTDEAYQQAYARLVEYTGSYADAPEVGLVSVEWFPGSVTPEAVERLPEFVRAMSADLQGKMLVLATGYSSAFVPEGDQARYYALALGNLADYRAGEGVDCPFIGVLWNTALDTGASNLAPPSENTVADMAGWDWASKAGEVAQMWTDPSKGSPELQWWEQKVEGGYGLVGVDAEGGQLEPKQAFEALTEAQTAIAEAAVTTGATETADQLAQAQMEQYYGQTQGGGGGGGGLGSTGNSIVNDLKNTLQQALNDIVGAYVQKVKDKILGVAQGIAGTGDQGYGGYGGYGGYTDTSGYGGGYGYDTGGTTGGGGGGGGGGAAGADLKIEGTVNPPANAAVGATSSISVSMFNAGTADAYNATAYLVDSQGYGLGQSSPTTVTPGGVGYATIQWDPYEAGNVTGAKILLYCDNELNPADNEQAMPTIPVAAAPNQGGGGGGEGGGGGQGGGGGGLGIGQISPGLLQAIKKQISPGFPEIGTVQIGSGVLLGLIKDPPELSSGEQDPARQPSRLRFLAKKALPLTVPVTNKFLKPIESLSAACYVNGKQVAAKQIGTLLPGSRRTILFSEWTPPSKGTYTFELRLQCLGTTRKVLRATISGPVMVEEEDKIESFVRPGLNLTPPRPTTRMVAPLAPSIGAVVGRPTVRVALPTGLKLQLTPDDVRLTPFPAAAGTPMQFSVNIQNLGTDPARDAKVEVFVDDVALGGATVDVMAGRPASAGGFKPWTAVAGRHVARAVVTAGGSRVEASRPFEIREALTRPSLVRTPVRIVPPSTGLRGAAAALPARIALTPLDIHFDPPMLAPGTEADISVNVRNLGGSPAQGVQVEAFADRTSLGTKTLNLPPGGSGVARGFDTWKAPEGSHSIRVVATLGSQKQEATKAVMVGTLRITRPPLTVPVRTIPSRTTLTRPMPSLVSIAANPDAPKAGDKVQFAVAVRNTGREDVSAVKVEFFVDADKVGEQTVRSIRGGATARVEGFPQWTAAAGRHTLRAVATVGLARTFSTQVLDVAGGRIGIRTPVLFTPDLAPTITTTPAAPKVGDPVTVMVRIQNAGRGAAKGARLTATVVNEADGKPLAGPPPATFDIAPGQTTTWTFRVQAPGVSRAKVTVVASVAGDANARNNAATQSIAFAPGRIPIQLPPSVDLGVQLSVLGRGVKAGDRLSFAVTVNNASDADAKGVRLVLAVTTDTGAALRVPVPAPFDVAAKQSSVQRFTIVVPACSSLNFAATVQYVGDRNARNNQARATVPVGRG